MPPKKKAPASKKAAEKAKIVEDKTFGLKNKKNSKKVQTYVKQVEQQATHKVEGRRSGGAGGAGPSQNSVAAKKAALAAKLEELQLLNQPLAERPKKTNADEEARRKAREEAEAERARFAALPVEDQIEEERAKLTTRTPVTLALFTAWKQKKDEERLARDTALLAAAQKNMSKAERARGGGLTGKSLFEQHQDIFVDDAEADAGKYKPDEKAWIGDGDHRGDGDGEAGDAAEGVGAAPADKQNRPEEQHEPPAKAESDGEGEGEAADAGVGDESLFS